MCWPHRVGVSVCHLAFIAALLKSLFKMAASVEIGDSLEGLEELFLQDITHDFFYLNEEKNYSNVPDK